MTVLRLLFERLPDTVFFILMVRIVDGTPLVLLEKDERHSETMKKMSVQDEDIMAMARDNRLTRLDQLDYAVCSNVTAVSVSSKRKRSVQFHWRTMKTDEGRRWKWFTTVYYTRQTCPGWKQTITKA